MVHSSGLGGTGRRGYECIRPPSPRHAGWTPPRRPVRTLRAFMCDAPEAWSWPKAPGQIEVGAIRRGYFCPGKKMARGFLCGPPWWVRPWAGRGSEPRDAPVDPMEERGDVFTAVLPRALPSGHAAPQPGPRTEQRFEIRTRKEAFSV